MSQNRDEDNYGGIAILLGIVLFFVLVVVVTEFIVIGAIAWKWGQKQAWTIYDRLNGFLAAIGAIFLSIFGTAIVGYLSLLLNNGFNSASTYQFWNSFTSGLAIINIGLFSVAIIATVIWFIRWLFTPSEQGKPISPKEWIMNYLQS